MNEHFPRWRGDPGSFPAWNNRLSVIIGFINARQGFARQEVITDLGIPAMHDVTIDVSSPDHGYVRVNSIDLLPTTHGVDEQPWPWTGVYYEEVPIQLVARAHPGWSFSHWEGDVVATTDTLVLALTDSISVTAVFVPGVLCEMELVHYWHFNTLPSGTLQTVGSDESVVPGAQIGYIGEGAGLMDRTGQQEGSAMNAQEGVDPGRALRVRNPSGNRHLIIEVPSTGYRDVELAFATRRTEAGPDSQLVEWTVDPLRQEWHPTVAGHRVWEQYMVRTFKPGDGLLASHSPHLAFRVGFIGSNTTNTSGNSRFDNITLRGVPVEGVDVVVCEEDEYTYEGEVYPVPGDHLVEIPGVMDCGHVRLLRLRQAVADTTVQQTGPVLEAMETNATYQWLDCNDEFTPMPGATDAVFIPESDGNYAVGIEVEGCVFVSGCHAVIGTSVGRISGEEGFHVYPDPTNGLVNVVVDERWRNARINVLDPAGAVVRSSRVDGSHVVLDLSGLAAGTYIIHVQGDGILRRRITKL
jgi:hypothetical protein